MKNKKPRKKLKVIKYPDHTSGLTFIEAIKLASQVPFSIMWGVRRSSWERGWYISAFHPMNPDPLIIVGPMGLPFGASTPRKYMPTPDDVFAMDWEAHTSKPGEMAVWLLAQRR